MPLRTLSLKSLTDIILKMCIAIKDLGTYYLEETLLFWEIIFQ